MAVQAATTVRMFGALHGIRRDRGLPSVVDVDLPAGGCAASAIASALELPLDRIDGVFVNHRVYPLDHLVYPGDRVAFIPVGVPGGSGLFSRTACR